MKCTSVQLEPNLENIETAIPVPIPSPSPQIENTEKTQKREEKKILGQNRRAPRTSGPARRRRRRTARIVIMSLMDKFPFVVLKEFNDGMVEGSFIGPYRLGTLLSCPLRCFVTAQHAFTFVVERDSHLTQQRTYCRHRTGPNTSRRALTFTRIDHLSLSRQRRAPPRSSSGSASSASSPSSP